MIKKIFTNKQLSLFFEIALLLNIATDFSYLIIYHFFSESNFLKLLADNISNVSIFVISLTIISQILQVLHEKYQSFVIKHTILATSIALSIAAFFAWLITIEDDIHSKLIIFASSLSKTNHSYQLIVIILVIVIMMGLDFYRTLTYPAKINSKSIVPTIRAISILVIKKHILILTFFFKLIKFKAFNEFAQGIFHYSETSLLFYIKLLEYSIPTIWIGVIGYYIYRLLQPSEKV